MTDRCFVIFNKVLFKKTAGSDSYEKHLNQYKVVPPAQLKKVSARLQGPFKIIEPENHHFTYKDRYEMVRRAVAK